MSMIPLDKLWSLAPANLVLSGNEIHVWRASLDQSATQVQQLAQTLSTDERIRSERFYFEQDKNYFVVGRGLLRTILGIYLGMEPSQLQFCYGPCGKPYLAETTDGSTLNFNLSHSQGLALYAIARFHRIGIDLEYIRPISEAEQIARHFFSPQENAVFQALLPSQKQAAFFNCWTRKEAYLKAIGDGLAFPLEQLDVSLFPGEPAQIYSIKGDRSVAARWSLQELTPAPSYTATLAVEGHDWHLICWQ